MKVDFKLWKNLVHTEALIILVILNSVQINAQTRNEPVNINWIFSLPWDVSNTLRAPFGGPVSILLTATTAAALLLGLLLAPVHYLLGYPARIYHTYRKPGILGRSLDSKFGGSHDQDFDMADFLVHIFEQVISTTQVVFDNDEDYNFGKENFSGRELSVFKSKDDYKPPEFLSSIFFLVPEKDETCRQLLLCHAHGFLHFFPTNLIKVYKILSKHFVTIPESYKMAIKVGLEDQGECQKVYDGCKKDLFHFTRGTVGIIRKNLMKYLLPDETKDLWKYFYANYDGTREN